MSCDGCELWCWCKYTDNDIVVCGEYSLVGDSGVRCYVVFGHP